jgi:hypothetical protein
MNEKRALLNHFLAALAYRTQKALRGAPDDFGSFTPPADVRSPKELVRHMTSVLGYSRTYFVGGSYWPERLESLDAEVERFHQMLASVSAHLLTETPLLDGMTEEQLLQGPFSDAMTHAGQLAMLRRFAGSPVAPENFIVADITSGKVGLDQSDPNAPDDVWPEAPANWTAPSKQKP